MRPKTQGESSVYKYNTITIKRRHAAIGACNKTMKANTTNTTTANASYKIESKYNSRLAALKVIPSLSKQVSYYFETISEAAAEKDAEKTLKSFNAFLVEYTKTKSLYNFKNLVEYLKSRYKKTGIDGKIISTYYLAQFFDKCAQNTLTDQSAPANVRTASAAYLRATLIEKQTKAAK